MIGDHEFDRAAKCLPAVVLINRPGSIFADRTVFNNIGVETASTRWAVIEIFCDHWIAAECAQAGADTFVAGTSLFGAGDLKSAITDMRESINEAAMRAPQG